MDYNKKNLISLALSQVMVAIVYNHCSLLNLNNKWFYCLIMNGLTNCDKNSKFCFVIPDLCALKHF